MPRVELSDPASQVFGRYEYIDQSGCNALRLWVQPWGFESGAPILPGASLSQRVTQFLQQWNELIPWALARDIHVVITMDISIGWPVEATWPEDGRSIWRDASAQDELVQAWRDLAERYRGQPGIVFDLLNEPHGVSADEVQGNHQLPKQVWNALFRRIVDAVETIDPERWMLVEPIWGDPDNFADLTYYARPRVLYSFHFYSPHEFTFQGAAGEWNASVVDYPGVAFDSRWNPAIHWDAGRLRQRMSGAVAYANAHSTRMVLGEFGCTRGANPDARLRWITDVLNLCDEYSFDWTLFRFEAWGVPASFNAGWALENSSVEPLLSEHFARNKI